MLGGVKFFTGKMPDEALKKFAGADAVELGSASKTAVAPSSFYGVVEYVIKTADKEIWVQLHPYSLGSSFYTLMVVEKSTALLSLNTNKTNGIFSSLEKDKKAIIQMAFAPDTVKITALNSRLNNMPREGIEIFFFIAYNRFNED